MVKFKFERNILTYKIEKINSWKEVGSEYVGYSGNILDAIKSFELRIGRQLEGTVYVVEKYSEKSKMTSNQIYIVDPGYFEEQKILKEVADG